MRKVPFFLGLFVLLFPLNWIRLYIVGNIPPGNDPRLVFPLAIFVLLFAAALIWWGLPEVRQSYAAVAEGPEGVRGPLMRLGAAIRDAHERSVQRRLEEQRQRELELEQACAGTLKPIDPTFGRLSNDWPANGARARC